MSDFNLSIDLDSNGASRKELAPAPRESKLNGQVEWNTPLQKLRSHIIQSDERGLPRYGVLSILARRVPFHLYDHVALTRLCNTAFTDGVHVFINTHFFAELMQVPSFDRMLSRHQPLVLLVLHELSHILFRHHTRLPPVAPPLLWAIACDIAINTRLLQSYPGLDGGALFDGAWGTKPEEQLFYQGQSEEHILHGLWEDPGEDAADFIQRLQQSLQVGSEGSVETSLDRRGQPQDVHHHLISAEQLAESLEEHGLQPIRAHLKLPNPHDKTAYQELHAALELQLLADLDTAKEMRELHPTGNAMAGDHLEAASSQWIENKYRGRLEWKNLLRDLVIGDGMHYQHSDEVPSDIYYVSPDQMGLNAPVFIGSPTLASPSGNVLCIVDTSGSITNNTLHMFVGELSQLIEQEANRLNHLYIASADTRFRGDVMTFSQHDLWEMPERLRLHGRGGTDIAGVINQAFAWAEQREDNTAGDLEAIIYFTDLLDKPPTREELPVSIPKLLFLSPPSALADKFRSRVADFATVAEIRDGTVIDLCQS
ncbi:MAG: VWA-like domain-containing protein [Pseudomonadota bacterium]